MHRPSCYYRKAPAATGCTAKRANTPCHDQHCTILLYNSIRVGSDSYAPMRGEKSYSKINLFGARPKHQVVWHQFFLQVTDSGDTKSLSKNIAIKNRSTRYQVQQYYQ